MKRSYAFWGALCIVWGISLQIGRERIPDAFSNSSVITITLAIGLIILGVSFIVRSQFVQTISSLIAGACFAFVLSIAMFNWRVLPDLGRSLPFLPQITIQGDDEEQLDQRDTLSDDEHVQPADSSALTRDTTSSKRLTVDSTTRKSIY